MADPMAMLTSLAAFFSELYHSLTEPFGKIFSMTNNTHRTERLIVQGACMLVIMPLIMLVIIWKIVLSPLLKSGDINGTAATGYGTYDDVGL